MNTQVAIRAEPVPVPDFVRDFPARARDADLVREAWRLCIVDGWTGAKFARTHSVYHATVLKWLKFFRSAQNAQEAAPKPVIELNRDRVILERARLYRDAVAAGDIGAQVRLLDAEARRLGVDQPAVSDALAGSLAELSPKARRDELESRITRLRQRGVLPVPTLHTSGCNTPTSTPGGSPQAGGTTLQLDTPTPRPTKISNQPGSELANATAPVGERLSAENSSENFVEGAAQDGSGIVLVGESQEQKLDAYNPKKIPERAALIIPFLLNIGSLIALTKKTNPITSHKNPRQSSSKNPASVL